MKNDVNPKNQNIIEDEPDKDFQKTSLIADAWKRLIKNKLAVAGMIILTSFVIIAIFAPWIAPYDPIKIHFGDEGIPPFWMRENPESSKAESNGTAITETDTSSVSSQNSDSTAANGDNEWSTGTTSNENEKNENTESASENGEWNTGTQSSSDTTTENQSSAEKGWSTGQETESTAPASDESSWSTGAESSTDDEAFMQSEESSSSMTTSQEEDQTKSGFRSDNFYLLGTDQMGRDLLSRIIFGARLTLIVGFVSVSISLLIGTILGLLSGFFGGIIDTIIMRSMDILLSFPYILLAIFIVSILGRGLTNAMIAIGIVGTPRFARVVRSQVLSVKEKEYVMASRTLGAGNFWLITRHIFVNSLSPLIVQTTMSLASAILYAAALGFLGLGAQAPTPEWGVMLSDARSAMLTAPWIITFPGIAIILCVLGFNLLGDGLRDSLDPRQKQ